MLQTKALDCPSSRSWPGLEEWPKRGGRRTKRLELEESPYLVERVSFLTKSNLNWIHETVVWETNVRRQRRTPTFVGGRRRPTWLVRHTFYTLAQSLPHQVHTVFDVIVESRDDQVHDRVHEDHEHHSEIENEQSASSPSEPTKQDLNENFSRTIKKEEACPKSRFASDVSAGFFKTILPQCKGSEGGDGCIW